MKNKIISLTIISLIMACPLPASEDTNHFGEPLTHYKAISLEQGIKEYDPAKTKTLLVKGQVTKVCQKKGCWMALRIRNGAVRVTFKNYGFFVPETIIGKTVLAQGELSETVMSVAEVRHYAMDAGMSREQANQITESTKEYRFIAEGVEVVADGALRK